MLVEVRKDYTANLGNRNFAKGGFSLSEDTSVSKADEVRKELTSTINRWIEEAIKAETERYAANFPGFSNG